MVATIQVELQMKDVDIGIVTHVSAKTGEDGPRQQVQFFGKKKVAFDIAMDKNTFFEAKHASGRNLGKLPIIEMSSTFDPSVGAGPSWKHGTLQQFF